MSLTPEQKARQNIDDMLSKAGRVVQDKDKIDFSAGKGLSVREYQKVGRLFYTYGDRKLQLEGIVDGIFYA